MACRQTGFGMGPITWETIDRYAERSGIDEEQTEAMHHHVVVMDSAYLKYHEKKMQKNGNNRTIQQKHQKEK